MSGWFYVLQYIVHRRTWVWTGAYARSAMFATTPYLSMKKHHYNNACSSVWLLDEDLDRATIMTRRRQMHTRKYCWHQQRRWQGAVVFFVFVCFFTVLAQVRSTDTSPNISRRQHTKPMHKGTARASQSQNGTSLGDYAIQTVLSNLINETLQETKDRTIDESSPRRQTTQLENNTDLSIFQNVYMSPCLTAQGIQESTSALLAARAMSKYGNSSYAWDIIHSIFGTYVRCHAAIL